MEAGQRSREGDGKAAVGEMMFFSALRACVSVCVGVCSRTLKCFLQTTALDHVIRHRHSHSGMEIKVHIAGYTHTHTHKHVIHSFHFNYRQH